MKKAVVIPDSFKGTLSSIKVCEIMKENIKKHFPNCEVIAVPVADGGEGSVDCFLSALGGDKIKETVKNPYLEDMTAFYGMIKGTKTAVIEMASCAGLPLIENRKNPSLTSSYGVGQLICKAAENGAEKVIVGLGGSCTNDGGTGAAAAAGVCFYNKYGKEFIPVGGTLKDIEKIDIKGLNKALKNTKIITMCDIDNPMYGENGAAYVFAPQKGADKEMVKALDDGLVHLSDIIKKELNIDVSNIKGGGAAGAMGIGMMAFFSSQLQMGIETVLDVVKFDDVLKDADIVFTGEGKFDSQSLHGKVITGLGQRTKKANVPLIVVAGGVEVDMDEAEKSGVTAAFSINRLPEDFSVCRKKSEENLSYTMDNILRIFTK